MNMALDLAELEQELARTRSALDNWASRKQQAALDLHDMHTHWMQDQTAKVQGMKVKCQQLHAASHQVRDRLDQEQQEVAVLHEASSALRQEKDVVQKRLVTLQDTLQLQELECQRKEADAMMEENSKNKKLGALRKALSLYSSRLGLEFRQGAEELQLVMTQVQASQPERPFMVAVRIQPDNTYQVTRCEPTVAALPTLVSRLNTSNDFSEFVRGLRLEWQRLVGAAS